MRVHASGVDPPHSAIESISSGAELDTVPATIGLLEPASARRAPRALVTEVDLVLRALDETPFDGAAISDELRAELDARQASPVLVPASVVPAQLAARRRRNGG